MLTLCDATIRLAGTEAVNFVAPAKVVERAEPFHCTVAPERKPVPFTVSVKAAPPWVVVFGLRLVITGPGEVIVNGKGIDWLVSGLTTLT
jgi:hypothetical protein